MNKAPKATTKPSSDSATPLMRQYQAIKDKHPDKILFFRMGDFYEMFGDDAVKAAPILGIALTSRSGDETGRIPLAGVPHHAAEKYLARLLEHGEKVVIVEQVEDPRAAKGIVKREVVEIMTPGTATIESMSQQSYPPSLASVFSNGNGKMGLAVIDMTTGSFTVDEDSADVIMERLQVVNPTEVICPAEFDRKNLNMPLQSGNGHSGWTEFGGWNFDLKTAERELNDHFGTTTLDGFGLSGCQLGIAAAGAVLRYLSENHHNKLSHINRLTRFADDEHMVLDYNTVRNLELIANTTSGGPENTLLSVIDLCHTPAGTRRLRRSLLQPFKIVQRIERRLSGVAELIANDAVRNDIREITKIAPDLERLAGRLGTRKLSPRQMAGIGHGLDSCAKLAEILLQANSSHLSGLRAALPEMSDLKGKLSEALVDAPPLTSGKGGIFRVGFSDELDAMNNSIRDARKYIASLQASERERTGINSLKVGFNKVFGYYLEITKANTTNVPTDYIRKQTLVNAERYITPELKEKEELILAAEEKIFACEARLYEQFLDQLDEHIGEIKLSAELLAEIDLTSGLAELAISRNYCRPEFFADERLVITEGRHPVIESVLPSGSFVANDLSFADEHERIHILTGPNMSGKSTYLRQIGQIVILAQIGSFVPAKAAKIGLVDRVFTRVGALDNLARGQSTFLVEMVETANILHNATAKSLVLLDEVGRGTSTFDGLSVAWAVVESIADKIKARTVFATHYHELTGMAEVMPSVKNFQVSVKKWEDQVIFLHQIVAGGCDDSYGIEVARLAGVPRETINRARQILSLLESGKFTRSELGRNVYRQRLQPTLFDSQPSATETAISKADLDNMSPLQALNFLKKLKDDLE